jgi:purine nucleosidase
VLDLVILQHAVTLSAPTWRLVGLRMLIDTDLGTNVDDALALAYAVRHPGIDLRAVTTVSGDSVVRAQLAAALLRAAGRDDVEVVAGRGGFDAKAWSGREGAGMPDGWQSVDVASDVDRALRDHDGEIVTIGMLTNVAGLAEAEPSWRPRHLTVMGGLFPPSELPPQRDHNLVTDPDAALAALGQGWPACYVPVDVTVRTGLFAHHVNRLRDGDALGRLLADLLDAFVPRTGHRLTGGRVAHLHDPLAVACTVDRSFVRVERLPVTVARTIDGVRTFIDPIAGSQVEVVRDVDAEAFADHWTDVVRG